MRLFLLLAASVAAAPAFAQDLSPIVVELRLAGTPLETMAWRDQDGAVYVDRETLLALRLRAEGEDEPVALSRVAGLTYREDVEEAAVTITCAPECYAQQELGLRPRIPYAPDNANGGFLNVDLAATAADHTSTVASAFELGLFNRNGFGGTNWTIDSESGDVTRLETNWNFDDPAHHRRVTFGDLFTRAGATGVPLRFGGVQIATDFSLDPGFVYFPTPTLRGEAAAPSTIDLYVDGVLRLRDRVDAGAFSITDAPVLTGAGTAQIVVTDALGRQQTYAQQFYSSPLMLRRGLSDYSLAVGAERNAFTRASNEYGRGLVSGVYRHGVSNAVTAEGRLEAGENDHFGAGVGASVAARLGQVDFGVAASSGEGQGYLARAGWTYARRSFSLGLEAQTTSQAFRSLGDFPETAPPRFVGAASWSGTLGDFGVGSLAYAVREGRDASDVRTVGFTYAPSGERSVHLSALYFDETGKEPFLTIGIGFSAQLGGDVAAGGGIEVDHGRASLQAGAQRAPDFAGGFGWRARASVGDTRRFDGGVAHIGPAHEASLETSITEFGAGVRAQYATAVVWIDNERALARPIRESFALVDVGVPNAPVLRDRRLVGVTNERGRMIVTGLRPYEPNLIGIDLDDLPWNVNMSADELTVRPRSRSGAVARFASDAGSARETRVSDAHGAPLPAGSILVRVADGARFPVGSNGRVFLSGIEDDTEFTGPDGCVLRIDDGTLDEGAPIRCAS